MEASPLFASSQLTSEKEKNLPEVLGAHGMLVQEQKREVGNTPPSVLVVDDNPLILGVISSLLNREHYTVVTAANGEEALAALKSAAVDVIVCDVMMPEMDGLELHQRVRGRNELSHIPFIFLSALSEPTDVRQAKELGADDYMTKPFDPAELLSVVKGKIARSRSLRAKNEEQLDAYRKKVVHTLSHEFRTPLVAISTGTELLLENRESLEPEKVKDLLEAIQRGGQRLERLVSDFMIVQQIEAGFAQKLFDARAQPVPLEGTFRSLIQPLLDEMQGNGCQASLAVAPAVGRTIQIYEPQLQDILRRILSNVEKFRSEQFVCEVTVTTDPSNARIAIADRGIGIDPKAVSEAIALFGQIGRENREQQGGGLGLAIASRLCEVARGSLNLTPRAGGGTVATITLPSAT